MTSDDPTRAGEVLAHIRDKLREFANARNWDQFHSPKNLSAALAVEAAELLEQFQWLTEDQSRNLDGKTAAAVRHELADVFIYLIRIADKLHVDLVDAANEKIELNAVKYPVEASRGSVQKYSDR